MNPGMLSIMADLERQGVRFAVAAVVETVGSVPGKLGARLILTGDGREIGTVGGAGVELQVKKLLDAALRTGRGGLHHFDLARQKPGGLDSV